MKAPSRDLQDLYEVAEGRKSVETARARLLNQAHFGPLIGLLMVTGCVLVVAWFLGRWLSQAVPPAQLQGWTIFGALLMWYVGMFYEIVMRHAHPRRRP